jgi:hypothetical protein
MTRALFVFFTLLLLAGCSNLKLNMAVPHTPGAYIQAAQGKEFVPVDSVDPRDAIVYIYRPVSDWGYAEVQAPSFFINDTELFGIKSGAYSWIELHPGTYDFYARRPLSILFLKTIFDLPLKVEGGKVYYFRYSELHPLTMAAITSNPEDFAVSGPIQQVPEAVGERQIEHLKLDEQGVFYGSGKPKPRWAPFYTYPATGTEDSQTLMKSLPGL